MTKHKLFWKRERQLYRILIVVCTAVLVLAIAGAYFLSDENTDTGYQDLEEESTGEIENGIHLATGLIAKDGFRETITHCTACHSAQLLTQNRLSREGWKETILWMQETQNLWDLGENEEIIINYLVTNYPPPEQARRANLKAIKWYELK